jgi:hypothetical protein
VPSAEADGGKKPTVEKLHIYVAEARFVIDKPPQAVDLSQYPNKCRPTYASNTAMSTLCPTRCGFGR